jgi:hypothetical protein
MRFARKISSRVIFLAEKGIYEEGTPEELFGNPKKILTQRFLYRSRMYETVLEAESFDMYSLSSELLDFLRRFETTEQQKRLIKVVCDELLHPLFSAEDQPADRMNLRLLCSETGSNHILRINVEGIGSDPLAEPYLDELNLKILENYSGIIFSKKAADGWEIVIQM